jgi:hypothetical protein
MTEERVYDDFKADETPNGVCNCGMPKMTIDGKIKCPNCSSKTKSTSNIVNITSDPGEDKLKEALLKPVEKLDFSGYQKSDTCCLPSNFAKKTQEISTDYSQHLGEVYNYLGTIAVDSVIKFKHLLKLKKKVLNLQTEIKLFLDTR